MENTESMLSVIMPIYNGEDFLEESIGSVLSSSYSNLELLLIDDGSTDGSREIMNRYSEADGRVKCIYKDNGGIVSARNTGLQNATGEYIAFIDQDDRVAEEMYETCIDRLIQDNSDVCCSNYYRQFDNRAEFVSLNSTNSYSDNPLLIAEYLIGGANLVLPDMIPQTKMSNTIWNCVYKNAVIQNNRLQFFTFVDYEDDWLFNIQYLRHIKRCSFESKGMYFWKIRGGQSLRGINILITFMQED